MLGLWNSLIVLLTVAAMEVVATLAHKYIMHSWGWGWHHSHHSPRTGWFELNDLYAVLFAALAIMLIALGTGGLWPLQWIGAGMTLYGVLYFMVHDGLVHQRWPFRYIPRRGYLRRLYMAHRLHHAVRGKEGCVSFGFLYAPPPAKLQETLRKRARRKPRAARKAAPPSAFSVRRHRRSDRKRSGSKRVASRARTLPESGRTRRRTYRPRAER